MNIAGAMAALRISDTSTFFNGVIYAREANMDILLKKEYFLHPEQPFANGKGVSATLIKYTTGVCGVKLTNRLGHITVLPFNGQMIWDAEFRGRSLKMRMPFAAPRDTASFLDTYGCYLMHCGALRMGCPTPQDNHALHGELPCAHYDNAQLITGEDERGEYMGVTGIFEYNRAFGDHYTATPLVKLYADSTLLDISMHVENLSNKPMELMYLCHINYEAVAGGEIVQTLPWDAEHMALRYTVPQSMQADDGFVQFLKGLQDNVLSTSHIREHDMYDPEAVFYLRDPKTDENGWAHFMQVHPDGSADYTSYKPAELDHCTRWISRTKDRSTLGLALPATADADGYLAEKGKGNIKVIPPKGSFHTEVKAGYLSPEQTAGMKEKIDLTR